MTKGQKALARKLRTSRVRAGVALQALAAFCGIDFSLISKYERGKRPLSQEVFGRLVAAIPLVADQEREKNRISELVEKVFTAKDDSELGALFAQMTEAEKVAVADLMEAQVVANEARLKAEFEAYKARRTAESDVFKARLKNMTMAELESELEKLRRAKRPTGGFPALLMIPGTTEECEAALKRYMAMATSDSSSPLTIEAARETIAGKDAQIAALTQSLDAAMQANADYAKLFALKGAAVAGDELQEQLEKRQRELNGD